MEIGQNYILLGQADGGGSEPEHPVNGYDKEGNLWVFGVKAIDKKRKPRTKKEGSLTSSHHKKKTGDIRGQAGVGGSINTNHTGDMERRRVENQIVNKEK